jgi:hypothetical protein
LGTNQNRQHGLIPRMCGTPGYLGDNLLSFFSSRRDAPGLRQPSWLMNVLDLLANSMINPLEFQRDIQEWLRYLLRIPLAYPLRFPLAAGLILLIFGLLAFRLAARTEQNQAAGDGVVAEFRARRRIAALVSLFCLLGIALGVQFARFTFAAHSVAPKQVGPSSRNLVDQVKVWEDPHHGIYHCSGSRWFGKTSGGRVVTLREAQYDGYRPYARPCPVNQAAGTQSPSLY